MKDKMSRLLACVLIIALVLPAAVGGVAYADNEESAVETPVVQTPVEPGESVAGTETVVTGEGTPQSPRLTETTTTETDTESGETTVTMTEEKQWSDESVTGEETGKITQTLDKDNKLINAEGSFTGSETELVDSESADGEELIQIDNGTGTSADGTVINSEVPTVDIELVPGGTDEQSEVAQTWFDEASLDLPDWVMSTREGITSWATPSHSEDNGATTDVSVNTDETGNTTTYTRTVTTADGKIVKETVTYVRNGGRLTDYSVVSEEVVSTTSESTEPAENAACTTADGSSKSYAFELPEKPTVETPEYAPDGSVLNGEIVAEICDASGAVVGYTVVTMKNGVAVGYGEPLLGRYVVTETVTETLENGLKKLTTTKTTTTSVKYSAKSGSVRSGERTVRGQMEKTVGTTEKSGVETYQPYLENEKDRSVDEQHELFSRPGEAYSSSDELYIRWCGEYGIESTIRVNGGNWQAHQFVLEGKNNERYYVYCCDFDTEPVSGSDYNIKRLEDTDYYKTGENDEKKDERIRAIVLNGYWGVENTSMDKDNAPSPGSLDAFRKMLTDAGVLTAQQAAKMTDGMALTATQAAIWYYGNSGQNTLSATDIVGDTYTGSSFDPTSTEKKNIINLAYAYLINDLPGQKATAENTLMAPEDFADTLKLSVGERNASDLYKTDITFTMAVAPNDATGDLVVYITYMTTVDGKEKEEIVGAYRLCGDDTKDAENNISSVINNSDGSYTLPGVYLPALAGINLNLKLKGEQKLDNGVYLFNCTAGWDKSQTFIGCGEVRQSVDISVGFGFEVNDPAVMLRTSASDSASEKLEWDSVFFTFADGGARNMSVPKTGDGMLALEVALALGALLSLAGTAVFLTRANRTTAE